MNNKSKSRSLAIGLIILFAGLLICVVSIKYVVGDTLQMALLSLGALIMMAGGLIMLFGKH